MRIEHKFLLFDSVLYRALANIQMNGIFATSNMAVQGIEFLISMRNEVSWNITLYFAKEKKNNRRCQHASGYMSVYLCVFAVQHEPFDTV